MHRKVSRNSSELSQNGPTGEYADILRVIHNIMENQQKQTILFRQGLITAPIEQRPDNVSDFRWLHLVIFIAEEKPLG